MRKTIIRATTFICSLITINVGFASVDQGLEEQEAPQAVAAVENKIFDEKNLLVTDSLERLIDRANGGNEDAQNEIVKRFASGKIHVRFAKLKPWAKTSNVEIDEQYVFFYLCWRNAPMSNFPDIDPNYDQMIIRRAKEGSAVAQNSLGFMYANGIKISQNHTKSSKWYNRAAEQGYAPALYNLSAHYGSGSRVDMAKAVELATRAAEQGMVAAQSFLGYLHLTNTSGFQDYERAFKWNKLAAEQGHPRAQEQLALIYLGDSGIPKNLAESLRWMILSGNDQCLHWLSMFRYATFNENEPQSSPPPAKESHQSALNQLYLFANQFGRLEDHHLEDQMVAPIFHPLCVSFMSYVNRLSRLSNHLASSPVLGTCFELSEGVNTYLEKQENPAFFHVYDHDDGKNYLTMGSDYVREIRDIDTLLSLPDEKPFGHGRYDEIAEQLMFHAILSAAMELGESIDIIINSISDLAFPPIDNLSQARSCINLFERSYSAAISKLQSLRKNSYLEILKLPHSMKINKTVESSQKSHPSIKNLKKAEKLLKQAMLRLTTIKGKRISINGYLQGTIEIIMEQIDDVGRRNHLCLKNPLYEALVKVWTSVEPGSELFVLKKTRWDGQGLLH